MIIPHGGAECEPNKEQEKQARTEPHPHGNTRMLLQAASDSMAFRMSSTRANMNPLKNSNNACAHMVRDHHSLRLTLRVPSNRQIHQSQSQHPGQRRWPTTGNHLHQAPPWKAGLRDVSPGTTLTVRVADVWREPHEPRKLGGQRGLRRHKERQGRKTNGNTAMWQLRGKPAAGRALPHKVPGAPTKGLGHQCISQQSEKGLATTARRRTDAPRRGGSGRGLASRSSSLVSTRRRRSIGSRYP